jgi:epoxyqueuosine reductase
MTTSASTLVQAVQALGWDAGVVPMAHLADVHVVIEGARASGLLDQRFYDLELSRLDYSSPESLPRAQSLVVVATPVPAYLATFAWRGRRHAVTVPPTYVDARGVTDRVRSLIAHCLAEGGYRVAAATIPLKMLATRSGLARYGRNNITYVQGMGSFHRLTGLFSDLPATEDRWGEPLPLERCEHCASCRTACPTGAITEDRFLLHAERCLSFFNEQEADMPDWIPGDAHHCLVGCMQCQRVCPENRGLLSFGEHALDFDAEETRLLLAGVGYDALPGVTAAKVDLLGFREDLAIIERNMRLLLGE